MEHFHSQITVLLVLLSPLFTYSYPWLHNQDPSNLLHDNVQVNLIEESYQPTYNHHSGRHERSADVMPSNIHFRFNMGSRDVELRLKRSTVGVDKDMKKDVGGFPVFVIENGRIIRKRLQHDTGIGLYANESTGSSFVVRKTSNRSDFILEGLFYDGIDQLHLTRDPAGGLHRIHKQARVVDFRDDYINTVNNEVAKKGNEEVTRPSHIRKGRPRQKRQILGGSEHEIQLFMVADNKDYRTWLKYYGYNSTLTELEMNLYYAFIANAMSVRYSSVSLVDPSFSLDIIITGLLIVNSQEVSYWTEFYTLRPGSHYANASPALESFRHWVKSSRFDLPASDHWMLFTGFDIFTARNPNVAGLAKLGGMCSLSSVSIIEQDNTGSVGATAAHELGHSLSALHDGEEKECFDEDNYIMSRKLKTPDDELLASRPWQFSPCSVRAFKLFVSEFKCTQKSVRGMSVLSTSLSPGQIFSADLQCQLALGNGSYFGRGLQIREGYPSMCRRMFCAVPDEPGLYQAIFAMEKTSCGVGKWCQRGKCVDHHDAPRMEDNCPQGDDPTAPCVREDCPYYTARTKIVYCCHTCRVTPLRWEGYLASKTSETQVIRRIEASPVAPRPTPSIPGTSREPDPASVSTTDNGPAATITTTTITAATITTTTASAGTASTLDSSAAPTNQPTTNAPISNNQPTLQHSAATPTTPVSLPFQPTPAVPTSTTTGGDITATEDIGGSSSTTTPISQTPNATTERSKPASAHSPTTFLPKLNAGNTTTSKTTRIWSAKTTTSTRTTQYNPSPNNSHTEPSRNLYKSPNKPQKTTTPSTITAASDSSYTTTSSKPTTTIATIGATSSIPSAGDQGGGSSNPFMISEKADLNSAVNAKTELTIGDNNKTSNNIVIAPTSNHEHDQNDTLPALLLPAKATPLSMTESTNEIAGPDSLLQINATSLTTNNSSNGQTKDSPQQRSTPIPPQSVQKNAAEFPKPPADSSKKFGVSYDVSDKANFKSDAVGLLNSLLKNDNIENNSNDKNYNIDPGAMTDILIANESRLAHAASEVLKPADKNLNESNSHEHSDSNFDLVLNNITTVEENSTNVAIQPKLQASETTTRTTTAKINGMELPNTDNVQEEITNMITHGASFLSRFSPPTTRTSFTTSVPLKAKAPLSKTMSLEIKTSSTSPLKSTTPPRTEPNSAVNKMLLQASPVSKTSTTFLPTTTTHMQQKQPVDLLLNHRDVNSLNTLPHFPNSNQLDLGVSLRGDIAHSNNENPTTDLFINANALNTLSQTSNVVHGFEMVPNRRKDNDLANNQNTIGTSSSSSNGAMPVGNLGNGLMAPSDSGLGDFPFQKEMLPLDTIAAAVKSEQLLNLLRSTSGSQLPAGNNNNNNIGYMQSMYGHESQMNLRPQNTRNIIMDYVLQNENPPPTNTADNNDKGSSRNSNDDNNKGIDSSRTNSFTHDAVNRDKTDPVAVSQSDRVIPYEPPLPQDFLQELNPHQPSSPLSSSSVSTSSASSPSLGVNRRRPRCRFQCVYYREPQNGDDWFHEFRRYFREANRRMAAANGNPSFTDMLRTSDLNFGLQNMHRFRSRFNRMRARMFMHEPASSTRIVHTTGALHLPPLRSFTFGR